MIKIEVTGTKELADVLAMISSPVLVNDILDEAAAYLLYKIRQRFLKETDPDGVKWVPSFASQTRKAKGRGGGTLFDTGHLFHSLQVYADGRDSRKIGTDVEYAHKHQFGIGQIPRPFLGLAQSDVEPITALVIDKISKVLKG